MYLFKYLSKALYCAHFRSEFAVVIWDPYTASNKSHIERVQRECLSFAVYLLKIDHKPHDYEPVLKSLDLQILVDRRVIANQIFLWKLVGGFIQVYMYIDTH